MSTMITTRGTDERAVVRNIVDFRGGGLSMLVSFFKGTIVQASDIGNIYIGQPVEEEKWNVVKKVLKERMTKD
jgi:hypothetical protein